MIVMLKTDNIIYRPLIKKNNIIMNFSLRENYYQQQVCFLNVFIIYLYRKPNKILFSFDVYIEFPNIALILSINITLSYFQLFIFILFEMVTVVEEGKLSIQNQTKVEQGSSCSRRTAVAFLDGLNCFFFFVLLEWKPKGCLYLVS